MAGKSPSETTTFYGINPASLEVDAVILTRGHVLTLWREGQSHSTHRIKNGLPPLAEVIRVFGMTDVVRISGSADALPGAPLHPSIARLHQLAAERRGGSKLPAGQ